MAVLEAVAPDGTNKTFRILSHLLGKEKYTMTSLTAKEMAFSSIDYSRVDVVKILIQNYDMFQDNAREEMNEAMLVVCLDIKRALDGVKLTSRQQEALKYYMEGWTEEDIGVKMGGITHQAVNKLINKVAVRIAKFLSPQGLQN